MSGTFNVPIYGMTLWGDLFTARQKVVLATLAARSQSGYQMTMPRKRSLGWR